MILFAYNGLIGGDEKKVLQREFLRTLIDDIWALFFGTASMNVAHISHLHSM